jgi:hypothetical protein
LFTSSNPVKSFHTASTAQHQFRSFAIACKRLKLASKKVDIPCRLVNLTNAITPIDEALALEALDDAVYEADLGHNDAQVRLSGL